MNERVRLFMMPVCVCGYVFRDLKLVPDEYPTGELDPDKEIFYWVRNSYEPGLCPNCHRIIDSVMTRDLKNEIDGSIIFVTP